jgi:hypothetical protein
MARLPLDRFNGPVRVALLLAALTPSVAAAAGWGDENWGEMFWGGPQSVVPTLPSAALLALAGLLAIAASALLRSRARARTASRWLAGALALAVIGVPGTAWAATISVPYSFSNGTIADATRVNANFGTLVTESNAQDGRIGSLETDLAAHEAGASAHHAKTTNASELTTGTLADARLSALVTRLGPTIDLGELAFDPATQAELDTHAGTASAHHVRYADAEAVAAVAADDAYVQNTGDTVGG